MDFEDGFVEDGAPKIKSKVSAKEALRFVDAVWYTESSRKARWMDLIGDYAGGEKFILDGDAVLQIVLDDPLLALGRPGDPSLQMLHARFSLERVLENLLKRGAVFDIVFWDMNRHGTLRVGCTKYEVASRALARAILFQHLAVMNVSVYVFEDLSDHKWKEYVRLKRPMFIMTNDIQDHETLPEHGLLQRIFWFLLLSNGLSVACLRSVKYHDSKIMAFLYEERRRVEVYQHFPRPIWDAHACAVKKLDACEVLHRPLPATILKHRSPVVSITSISEITDLCQKYLLLINSPPDPFSLAFLHAFATHLLLLDSVPIEDRAQPLPLIESSVKDTLISSFLPSIFTCLESVVHENGWNPDVDTRLFVRLVEVLGYHSQTKLPKIVGNDAAVQIEEIWAKLGLPPVDFSILASKISSPSFIPVEDFASSIPEIKVLPFNNDVFNAELASVHVETDDTTDVLPSKQLEFGGGTPFTDTHHWHNHRRALLPKHLGGEDPLPRDAWARQKQLKRQQRFMANMQKHASTLTGAAGMQLQQQIIAPVGLSHSSAKASKVKVKVNPRVEVSKKGKAPPLTSKERILRNIQEEKQMKEDDSSSTWWTYQLSKLERLTVRERIEGLQPLFRNKHVQDGWLSLEFPLYRLHLEITQWMEDPAKAEFAVAEAYVLSLLRSIMDMCGRKQMSSAVFSRLENVLHALGFGDYVRYLKSNMAVDVSLDRPLSFKFVKVVGSKTKSPMYEFMSITEHPIIWQLRHFGEYMDRSMDSQPDSRVSFEPDGWQREVLDALDADKSVLVVAPTSAGKTFISFYAMEKVLRTSDDDILVYIAPTKALVNQVASEIYARFSKDVSNGCCWAIHTRDYRVNNPQNCQILVTVPEMFAIMLLSPALSRVWTPRIKRVILDEIHTIGQQEGGAIWEQILLLAPCPIIGLSATIGHPEVFNKWLESVQRAHGFEHTFIHHPHRYSHLRKHVYLVPSQRETFAGLDVHKTSDRLRFLHPISMLGFGTPILPPDLSLEARDTLTLFEAMSKIRDDLPANVDLDSVDPLKFFNSSRFLRQQDILNYEVKLKQILTKLMSSSDSIEATSPLQRIVRSVQDACLDDHDLNVAPSPDRFLVGLPPLIADLHCANNLPALFFSFDRHNCEIMAQRVLMTLQDAESNWRNSSPRWKKKLQDWEAWKTHASRQAKTAAKQKKQHKDSDDDPSLQSEDVSWEQSFDPSDPSPQFSFADHRKYSQRELEEDIEEFAWTSTPRWVRDALKRGIGVHHSGMNKAYRSIVESLFRKGFLRVVFATGTLALGINAPTKTSVFCGDSPFLTALMFRQCAGRAGRRGYDLLGNVIFYGLALDRIQRLVLSKLPLLTGSFPLSSTLCLRLFNLLHGSNNAPVAVRSIQSLLRLPEISFGSDTGHSQLLHHLRFSIDYLRRAGLLDLHGAPMNLFAVASHLYHTDPSNLALVALLRHGVLHEICGQTSLINAKFDFMVVMCHLFGRRYLPNSYANETTLQEIRRSSPSRVVIPPLPPNAHKVLVEHNEEILRIFSAYAFLYASQYEATLGRENKLPLSGLNIGTDAASSIPTIFEQSLHRSAIPLVIRSPFVANSGHSDRYTSISELVHTCRRGLHLDEHAIPSLTHITEKNESSQLNAYLLDFFIHGQVQPLVSANGIRRGDVWFVLQEFVLTLMTIRGALEQLLLKASRARKDANVELESRTEDADSGYISLDTAEADELVTDLDASATPIRPEHVSDKDWRVYEVINSVLEEFSEKFKKMWA